MRSAFSAASNLSTFLLYSVIKQKTEPKSQVTKKKKKKTWLSEIWRGETMFVGGHREKIVLLSSEWVTEKPTQLDVWINVDVNVICG